MSRQCQLLKILCFIKPTDSWKVKKKSNNKTPSVMLMKKLLIEEGEQDGLSTKDQLFFCQAQLFDGNQIYNPAEEQRSL